MRDMYDVRTIVHTFVGVLSKKIVVRHVRTIYHIKKPWDFPWEIASTMGHWMGRYLF